ncbi:aminoglycoside N(3)-acetyltransferase [Cohnella sp.]|uniref:aminoglycoside N(3)-acetyltransferase n=1 Tax=Cohnella sp. TaxID=1883426 RepID=UPI00356468B2
MLIQEFMRLGLYKGMTLIVHSSLRSLGWVSGGPVTVVQALMEVITEEGTLVMPTHSGENSDPSHWQCPSVPEDWWDTIRETMPAFHPTYSPTRGMGKVPDVFRTFPEVIRSYHPSVSFAAWGKDARFITDGHSLDFGLGEQSPLARLYDLDSSVLLLGVDYDSNTSFHLAENRLPNRIVKAESAPVIEAGERVWATYSEIEYQTELFVDMGIAFEKSYPVTIHQVAASACKLFKQRDCVDFGLDWLMNRAASDTL